MVQQADGSWQPLGHTDENAPIPPPPWEPPADVSGRTGLAAGRA